MNMSLAFGAEPAEQRVVLSNVSWGEFLTIARKRDAAGRRNVRLHYLDGELELMAVGDVHEYLKKTISRLVERWSEEVGVDFHGVGSWTIKNRRRRTAAEADECYHRGGRGTRPPDLAIEVAVTHGGLDQLAVYRGLSGREVWFCSDDHLSVHVLEGSAWHVRAGSELLPELDIGLLKRCARTGDQPRAIGKLLAALRH